MVSRDEILHLARLAKLELAPAEEERLVAQLGRILDYVAQLREVDEKADELTHVAVVEAAPRGDDPRPGLPRAEVLALAPKSDGETVHVPAVIDGEGSA
ncbi:MAG: Asp-tRNA(Asn)/Glu-tRNA(Gln) amidotransferase subunit GatC [Candidatus Eiseniibacteriota bacterium]